jgi:UDP-N-acetylglucosamine 1-carboxyvinyltransferase
VPVLVDGQDWGGGGCVPIAGAKNAALPLAMATLLVDGRTTLRNAPDTATDVAAVAAILRHFGLRVALGEGVVVIDNRGPRPVELPRTAWASTRYSALLIGIALRLFGRVAVGHPGGCRLGCERPLDIHLDGLASFGAEIATSARQTTLRLRSEREGTYRLRYPSVGATEALILFAVLAPGTRTLENCAREPEVTELCAFLCHCGARIADDAHGSLTIEGVDRLAAPGAWTLLPDRVEAATFAVLAAVIERDLSLAPVVPDHLETLLYLLEDAGVPSRFEPNRACLHVRGSHAASGIAPMAVHAAPYPGLATDVQPLLAALCLKARGTSTVTDQVFPNRFAYAHEFRKLGASMTPSGRACAIEGGRRLRAARLRCHDIRTGAACVLAALLAHGRSCLEDAEQIDRGYADLLGKLQRIGLSTHAVTGNVREAGTTTRKLRRDDAVARRPRGRLSSV